MKSNNPPNMDFERLLARGHHSYNRKVGDWWREQAENGAHKRAYKNISQYLYEVCNNRNQEPAFIVDYACGDGAMLLQLAKRFSQARLIGLDGSQYMLELAEQRFYNCGLEAGLCKCSRFFDRRGPRVRLVKTVLPNFHLPAGRADAVIYTFPNLTCSNQERKRYNRHGYNNRSDSKIAKMLSRFREMDPEEETEAVDPEECYDDLMTAKVISRNLRQLMKPGGILIRVDYANAPRDELTDLTQWRSLFTEGALDVPIQDCCTDQLFRYQDSSYRRSAVILDVYHQTGDPSDREGGYFSSVFKAV
jgi:SAM-dependent methyltransferase